MLSYKLYSLPEGRWLNLNACSHIKIAYSSKYWSFFLYYMHTFRMNILHLNTQIQVCFVFKLDTCLNKETSSAPIFTNSHIQKKKGLRQTDATLVLLQTFMFKIINLKSSIWLKHLHVRDTSVFYLWLPRHSQFFCKHHRLNWMWAPKVVYVFHTRIK